MTLLDYAKENGSWNAARAAVNRALVKNTPFSIDDLPDGPVLDDYVHQVSELIEQGLASGVMPTDEIRSVLSEVISEEGIESLLND